MPSSANQDRYPLTPIQQGMLLHQLVSPGSGFDIEQMVVSLEEHVDPRALRQAWQRLTSRHAVLRTSFAWDGLPQPLQAIHASVELPWRDEDWSTLSAQQHENRLEEYLREDRRRGFDPRVAPLARCALFQKSEENWLLVWTFHHMLADGGSYFALIREAFSQYEAIRAGRTLVLPEPPRYQNFIEWQQDHVRATAPRAETHWRELLRGFSAATSLPESAPGPGREGYDERSVSIALSPPAGISMSTLVTSAWALVLARNSGEEDVVFGETRACRGGTVPNASDTAGLFINTLPVRVRLPSEEVARTTEPGSAERSGVPDCLKGRAGPVRAFEELARTTERAYNKACSAETLRVPEDLEVRTGPVRAPQTTVRDWLMEIQEQRRGTREFEHTPLADVQRWSETPAGSSLFQSLVVFTPWLIGSLLRELGGEWLHRRIEFRERTNYPLTLFAYNEQELLIKLSYDRARFSDDTIERLLAQLETALQELAADPERGLAEVSVLSPDERRKLLVEWNETHRDFASGRCIHEVFEEQAALTPDALAVVFRDQSLTYAELNRRANQLAQLLKDLGSGPDQLVGVCLERSLDMTIALLAVLKSGAAYVPLDPGYPKERTAWVLEDTRASVILTQNALLSSLPIHPCEIVCLDHPGLWERAWEGAEDAPNVRGGAGSSNLAYVLFTSGSSGRPKGVMIEHRNVMNFFAGMDEALGYRRNGTWLAVTSISFDISVLELLWTLCRGFKVAIHKEDRPSQERRPAPVSLRKMDFSLFYFAAHAGGPGGDKYRLLMEGAKYADAHGFAAVWTPERHFHEFGGLYPNAALTSAAVAAVTSNIQIRAGSVVLPLHNPIRVAEEWSVVDNLSGGRVGLSFASGWHANDFALMPENYANRRNLVFQGIETVRKLWRGESIARRNGAGEEIQVRIFPTPVQRNPEIWITASTNVDTFRMAGEMGANLLTNLLGQQTGDLAHKIAVYREARRAQGHAGEGRVTLMMHTFVGADTQEIRTKVRKPFTDYLKTSTDLIKQARWEFPAFGRKGKPGEVSLDDDETGALMDHAFDRYFETSGLFGSVEDCLETVERLRRIGVDEIACLIDFGVNTEAVLESLPYLNTVRERSNRQAEDYSVAGEIRRHRVTHLQCTPSMARMLMADADSREALRPLEKLLLGGEALPPALAEQAAGACAGELINMYGPTETTVWSTVAPIAAGSEVSIGRPIANTQIYIVDRALRPVPIGAAGELLIGGAGIARGYLNRAELTADKFVANPFGEGRLYRTGDLARYREDGRIEFLRRLDSQVKIHGYRIEMGDVEAALEQHADVWESAVAVRPDSSGEVQLVAYVAPKPSSPGLARESDGEAVARWTSLWDQAYRAQSSDPAWNLNGWNSSYTGEPIPGEDMREWVDATVGRIRALLENSPEPKRVLEIGCGTGLLLFQIAPHCDRYQAMDPSAVAIESIQREVRRRGLVNVSLRQASAEQSAGLHTELFDVIVINSVAQYFPDENYLVKVLEHAAAAVRPGGAIFVGDVRNRDLLEAFHASVELARAPSSLGTDELKRRIRQRAGSEGELLVAPAFFRALRQHLPRIGEISIQLKRGRRHNELTRFRYDVTLKMGPRTEAAEPEAPGASLDQIGAHLNSKPVAAVFKGIRNPRLSQEIRALELLNGEACPATAGELRGLIEAQAGIEPEDLWSLPVPYDIEVRWSGQSSYGQGLDRYDAVFRRRGAPRLIQPVTADPAQPKPWHEYVNRRRPAPAAGTLIRELTRHMKEKLPSYMAPAAYVILDALPRTPNGKIDWKALPAPEQVRREVTPAALPKTDTERLIAAVWKELLNLDAVGRNDNFFDLGANSLTMVRASSRLREQLQSSISLVDLFRYPTVGSLAAHVSEAETTEPDLQNSESRGRARLDAALRRMHARQVASEEKGA
jgi:natural product biosynthesis luciferase-like monooxygenase protein